jgi:hypothetical membrane protein
MFNSRRRVEVYANRHPLIGPTFWIVSIQYFITQILVAAGWPTDFSLTLNPISDLGNTECGEYAGRYVCSPYYTWMNASFIVLGATMIAGSSLIYQQFKKNLGTAIGFSFMALAGLGTILVGIFPENSIGDLHWIGAALPFVLGNIGIITLGFSLALPKWFKYFSIFSGFIALTALVFFYSDNYLGLGIGGMERIVAYPQTIWLIVFGIYMSERRFTQLEPQEE